MSYVGNQVRRTSVGNVNEEASGFYSEELSDAGTEMWSNATTYFTEICSFGDFTGCSASDSGTFGTGSGSGTYSIGAEGSGTDGYPTVGLRGVSLCFLFSD